MRQSIQEWTKSILWKTTFKIFEMIWFEMKWYDIITSDLLKAIFHKFYSVGSWMLYFIYKGNAVSVRPDTGVNMTMTWKVVNAKNHMSWNLQKKTKHTSGIWKKASQKIYAPARFSQYMHINWETHSNYWFLYVI